MCCGIRQHTSYRLSLYGGALFFMTGVLLSYTGGLASSWLSVFALGVITALSEPSSCGVSWGIDTDI